MTENLNADIIKRPAGRTAVASSAKEVKIKSQSVIRQGGTSALDAKIITWVDMKMAYQRVFYSLCCLYQSEKSRPFRATIIWRGQSSQNIVFFKLSQYSLTLSETPVYTQKCLIINVYTITEQGL